MRRISLLLAALLVAWLPLTALAEPDPTATPDPGVAVLEINETEVVRETEPNTYAEGYLPKVTAGREVTIKLPLKGDIRIAGNVTLSADITSEDIAFEPMNNLVVLSQLQSGTNETAQFVLQTKASCYNGRYPAKFKASFDNGAGLVEQVFTVYVEITGNPTPTPKPDPTVPPTVVTSMPKLMVTGYTITPENVMAGESMQVTLTVQNMSDKRTAQNIEVVLSSDGNVFFPKGGTNSAYIGRLKAGEQKELTFSFDVKPDAAPAPSSISVDIRYEDTQANSGTASSVISVPVNQPLRVRLSDATAYADMLENPFSVSLTIVNMGKSTLYNVAAELSQQEDFYQQSSYYGGTLEPGAQKTIELSGYVMSMSQDMEQVFSGTVTVSYEDVAGHMFTEEKPFTFTIYVYPPVDPGIEEPVIDIIDEPSIWVTLRWLWIALGGTAVVLIIVLVSLRGRRRRKVIEDELL